MKERITFLISEDKNINPAAITVDADSLNYTATSDVAAIEQRTTWSLNEFPKHLKDIFEDTHEVHIRWSQWTEHKYVVPRVSRLPAGLHIFYTPRDKTAQNDKLCSALQAAFGISLGDIEESFSRPAIVSERFASAASYQFYHTQPSLAHLSNYLHATCSRLDAVNREECLDRARDIATATEIDLDFDVISHALVVTTSRPATRQALHSHRKRSDVRHEIGILRREIADEPEELKLGGLLTILGEDSNPSGTLFSFPSRHHPLPPRDQTVYISTFQQPTGLHPTLQIKFPGHKLQPPQESCVLHTYLTLPSALFLDRYQLSDPAFLSSKNLKALRALSGAEDLEAPNWAVKRWGSASLLEIHTPDAARTGDWIVEIPLHLRYLQAADNTSNPTEHTVSVPSPIVFWACEAEEGLKMSTNPFDRVNLGYDGLFGPKTMFYHIPAGISERGLTLKIPTLDPASASWLPVATLMVVSAGIIWVLWSLVRPLGRKTSRVKTE